MEELDTDGIHKLIEEPIVGNPIRIELDGKLISQDLANSIIEYRVLTSEIKENEQDGNWAELGPGYGRLAFLVKKLNKGPYFLFDIMPALSVSQYYLSEVFEDKK